MRFLAIAYRCAAMSRRPMRSWTLRVAWRSTRRRTGYTCRKAGCWGGWGLRQADDRRSAGNVLVTALTTTLGLIEPLRSKQSSAPLFSSDHLIDLGNRVLRQWKRQKIVTQLSSFYSLNDCAALERELKSYRREHAIFKRKALTPTIPPTLISRADEVIE